MRVASLNSHLYYLSASKSARANARLLVRAAAFPPSPPPAPPAAPLHPPRNRDSPGLRACHRVHIKKWRLFRYTRNAVKRQCRWQVSLLTRTSRAGNALTVKFFNSRTLRNSSGRNYLPFVPSSTWRCNGTLNV